MNNDDIVINSCQTIEVPFTNYPAGITIRNDIAYIINYGANILAASPGENSYVQCPIDSFSIDTPNCEKIIPSYPGELSAPVFMAFQTNYSF